MLEEVRRTMSEALDKAFYEPTEKMRETRQHSTSLEQDARKPSLTLKADVTSDRTLASVRKMLQQIKRSMGIAALQKESIPARRV